MTLSKMTYLSDSQNKMERKKAFGSRLKLARERARMTQMKLIEKMDDGLNQSLLSKYEAGKSIPQPDRLSRFASLLDVSEAWLQGLDGQEQTISIPDRAARIQTDLDHILAEFKLLDQIARHIDGSSPITDFEEQALCRIGLKRSEMPGHNVWDLTTELAPRSSAISALRVLSEVSGWATAETPREQDQPAQQPAADPLGPAKPQSRREKSTGSFGGKRSHTKKPRQTKAR